MFQSNQVSPVFEHSPTKITKSAFTQLTLTDSLERNDHKTNRESSCESDLQPSVHHDKNYLHQQNQSQQINSQDHHHEKPFQNYLTSMQCIEAKNRKHITKKFVDQETNHDQRNKDIQGNTLIVKGSWSKEEDQFLIQLVLENGAKNWSCIAKKMKGRMGKQCRERWHNHLNPDIKKQKWTEQQDLKIIEYHRRFGNKWALISRYLPGRTDNAIKNHWNSTISRKLIQQHMSKKIEVENEMLSHTPKKAKQQKQWNTANTFPYPQTPEQPTHKCPQHISSIPINLFSKKTMESQSSRSQNEKLQFPKIGFVFPYLTSLQPTSAYYLQQIQSILSIDSHKLLTI